MPRHIRIVVRLLLLVAIVATLTWVCHRIVNVNATTAGFIYLLAVLFSAAFWGLVESIFISFTSVLLFNFYFLPPVGTLTISDPQNWVALVAFLATAIIAGKLSDTIRRQTAQAVERQREMEQLYSLSRAILLLDSETSICQQLASHVSRVFDATAVALYENASGKMYCSGPEKTGIAEDILYQASTQGTEIRDVKNGLIVTAVRLGSEPIGSLALKVRSLSDSALSGLANLVAIGIERAKAQEQASRLEAARQSDKLKSTLLDAIAHEFKTPLTSIKVASTALLTSSGLQPEQTKELITVMDEEADRLSSLVSEAIQAARLEAGRVRLSPAPASAEELLMSAAHTIHRLTREQVQTAIEPELPALSVDRELFEVALRQLIDNAVKYSPPGSCIRLTASRDEQGIRFSVEDRGMGVPEAEREKIFDRFYRANSDSHNLPGAGLGLAIARNVVQAHGGNIWMEPAATGGSIFFISIPVRGADEK